MVPTPPIGATGPRLNRNNYGRCRDGGLSIAPWAALAGWYARVAFGGRDWGGGCPRHNVTGRCADADPVALCRSGRLAAQPVARDRSGCVGLAADDVQRY